jgi:gliding motility-associated-like protein
MNNRIFYIAVLLIGFLSECALSQINCITDPPLPPVLTSVSVQPESGNTIFTWTLSPSAEIAAYILYSFKNGDGMALDTIWDPAATSFTLSSTATKYFSVTYVVAAMRLPRCTSVFSNALTSIFEEASIDTCLKKIKVTWNSYTSAPLKVTGYSVLLSVNSGPYTISGNLNASETTFKLDDFTIDAEYCFVTRAELVGGSISNSNKSCVSTKMQHPPAWINADQATLSEDGSVALSFTIDPASEIKHFSLERRIGLEGTFEEIAQPASKNGSVSYIDKQADTSIVNYYRLSAVNSCNIRVVSSNIASNIVLSLQMTGSIINLSWNSYKNWLGQISSYKLFINTGKGFEQRSEIPASDTVFAQDYKQIMYEVTGNEVCFYIDATEDSNPYGITGRSKSSEVCTIPAEIITVPNVFTPNADLKNDLFRPVLSFTPKDYHLIITDRQGHVLFETRDFLQEWNGMHNGDPQPEGVCLWFLKLTTPTGRNISKTGTLTIITSR